MKTVKFKSKAHGEIEIKESEIIKIVGGILGFEGKEKYAILDKERPLKWLQCVEDPDIAFVIIKIKEFFPSYRLVVDPQDLNSINLEDPRTAEVYAIVTIPAGDPSLMTANLLGPIVVNPKNNLAKQMISLSPDYTTKHYLLTEEQRKAAKEFLTKKMGETA